MIDSRIDEMLLGRLRRLVETAKTAHLRDRRNVLSLETDIHALRTELTMRCAVLAEQMKDASARTKAIFAYARTGSLARGVSYPRQK